MSLLAQSVLFTFQLVNRTPPISFLLLFARLKCIWLNCIHNTKWMDGMTLERRKETDREKRCTFSILKFCILQWRRRRRWRRRQIITITNGLWLPYTAAGGAVNISSFFSLGHQNYMQTHGNVWRWHSFLGFQYYFWLKMFPFFIVRSPSNQKHAGYILWCKANDLNVFSILFSDQHDTNDDKKR